jgi:hypothetical protein
MTVEGPTSWRLRRQKPKVRSSDFLSCYLQEASFARVIKDMEEGGRLATPNGDDRFEPRAKALLDLIEHHVEEEERTLFPKVKTISYEPRK